MTDEARDMGLLRFALGKEGVSSRKYFIALEQEPDQEDRIILRKSGDKWQMYFVERGKRYPIGEFNKIYDAVKHLFWELANPASPWSYLKEFENSLT